MVLLPIWCTWFKILTYTCHARVLGYDFYILQWPVILVVSWLYRVISWKCHSLITFLMLYMQLKLPAMHQMQYVPRKTLSIYISWYLCVIYIYIYIPVFMYVNRYFSLSDLCNILYFLNSMDATVRFTGYWSQDNVLLHMSGAWLILSIHITKNIKKLRLDILAV